MLTEIIQDNGVSKTLTSKMKVILLSQSKGFAETAMIMVLLSLIGNVAVMSVGIGGFQDVLGMGADSNAAGKLEDRFITPVRNVCVQGTDSENRTPSFTLSSTVNVSLVSEDADTLNDQSIRGILVEENAELVNSDQIEDCVIEFSEAPSRYRVFEKGKAYQLTIENEGTQQDKPATLISVEER